MNVLRGIALAFVALLLLAWVMGYGYREGWWVDELPAKTLATDLAKSMRVFVPDGRGPFPTILQFHGCGGSGPTQLSWAQVARAAGYASIIVDSYAHRGLDPADVCSGTALLPSERAGDVLAVFTHAKTRPFVDPEHIVMAGWSHGASSILELLARNPPTEVPPNIEPDPSLGLEGLAGAVFFYPYCGFGIRASVWENDIPSLFLLAKEDSVAPPEPCIDLADDADAAGQQVTLRGFKGAAHAWDHTELGPESRLFFSPEATAASRAELLGFLASVAAS